MTIEIQQPELVALIEERMKSGRFAKVEDVLLEALQPAMEPEELFGGDAPRGRSLVEISAMVRGMAEDCDFSRSRGPGRPVIDFNE